MHDEIVAYTVICFISTINLKLSGRDVKFRFSCFTAQKVHTHTLETRISQKISRIGKLNIYLGLKGKLRNIYRVALSKELLVNW